MTEPKPVYFTGKLVGRLQSLLKEAGTSGKVVRVKLERGLGCAYAGDVENGRLTLSRNGVYPSDKEVMIVEQNLKKAASNLNLSILDVQVVERVLVMDWCLIRIAITYGKQRRLFDEEKY